MTPREFARRRKAHNLGALLAGTLSALLSLQVYRFAGGAPTGLAVLTSVAGALWIANAVQSYIDKRLAGL